METLYPGPFTFTHELRVRWAECDPQGIVFNPHYLMYFDVAFTEYMRGIGFAYPDGLTGIGADVFAAASSVQFRDAARYDDVLRIGVRTRLLGRTSFTIAFAIWRGGDLLTTGETVYVVAGATSRQKMPIPPELRAAITNFEHTPAEEKP